MSGRVGTIAILTHLRQGLNRNYFLGRCLHHHWVHESDRSVLVHQGTADPPAADVAILHVDLTVVPDEYLALARRYAHCVNGRVADISKRRISAWLVGPDDAYDGPVVVKSDLNHGGQSERLLRLAEGGTFVRLREAALRWLPRAWGGRAGDDYQLFERRSQVPAWVWRRPDLVVERFFAEPHPQGYVLNQWLFLGPRGIVSSLVGPQPMVKWYPEIVRLPPHHDVPEGLWRRRQELGIEFGKIDYIMHEGEAVVIDANPTPYAGLQLPNDRNIWMTGIMAAGIDFVADGGGW